MKEMIYQAEYKREVLHSGLYQDYKFIILNLGLHPTAYVENKNGFSDFYEANEITNYMPHGGFTYCGQACWDKSDNRNYIGWDYAHCDDFSGYYIAGDGLYETTKRWTTAEIFEEVKRVIDFLRRIKQ